MLVNVVCEGPTDYYVLRGLVQQLVPGEKEIIPLQPEFSASLKPLASRFRTGWEGVRRWCEDCAKVFGTLSPALLNGGVVLIIHVDADIAGHPDVDCRKDCPPASATVDALRGEVLRWGKVESLPAGVVLCIPSQAIEAWVYAALYARDDVDGEWLECRKKKPETLLKQRPEKLVSGPENKKDTAAYRQAAARVAQAWPHVCSVCTQAERFDHELRTALGSPS